MIEYSTLGQTREDAELLEDVLETKELSSDEGKKTTNYTLEDFPHE